MSRKASVLEHLTNSKAPLSGQVIADELKITRAAVWKTIETLRKEGYLIEGVPNQGYRLQINDTQINPQTLKELLPSYEIEVLDQVDSTNSEMKRRSPKGKSILVSHTQKSGRGRLGRSFFSPRGGLYFTIALPLDMAIDSALLITSAAAVATSEALATIAHVEPSIKWVNDLFLGDTKICGILTEGIISMERRVMATVIVGIGINLHLDIKTLPAELQGIAGSVFDPLKPLPIDPHLLIADIIARFDHLVFTLPDTTFLETYRTRSNLIGKEVRVYEGEHSYVARVEGIDEQAHLLITDSEGFNRTLLSGEVSIRLEG